MSREFCFILKLFCHIDMSRFGSLSSMSIRRLSHLMRAAADSFYPPPDGLGYYHGEEEVLRATVEGENHCPTIGAAFYHG